MKARRFSILAFIVWFFALSFPTSVLSVLLYPTFAAWAAEPTPLPHWRLIAFRCLLLALPAVAAFMLARRGR